MQANDENSIFNPVSAAKPLRRRRRSPPFALIFIITAGLFAVLGIAYTLVYLIPDQRRQVVKYELKKFALLYHNFYSANKRAPSRLSDLEGFSPSHPFGIGTTDVDRAPVAFEMIRNGQFIIIWDAVLLSADENEKYVLGYESPFPKSGGLVMRAGGSVSYNSVEQFEALKKIGTTDSSTVSDSETRSTQ